MSAVTVSQNLSPPAAASRSLSRLWPPVLLLALTIGVFWKITLTGRYTWLNNPDTVNQILPWMQEEAAQFQGGSLPLWDPHHWDGQSLLGQDQPGVLFPLNWLLWLMPFEGGHVSLRAIDWYFVAIHYFAALFCYLLARDLTLSMFASLCSGISFGLAGFLANVDWPQMLNGGMWTPLVLLFAIRAINGRRPLFNMAAAGCIQGFAMWGGHHQLPTFTLLSVAFLLGYQVSFRGLRWVSAAKLGLVCVGFTILAGAPQLLPSYEYWSRGLRWVGSASPVGFHDRVPYIVFEQFSLNPAALIGVVLGTGPGDGILFAGITTFSLALLGALASRRRGMASPFAALAVAALVFSLGKFSLFHGILYSLVPLIDKSRTAAFAVFILDIALAILAGYGIDCLLDARDKIGAQLGVFAKVLLGFGGTMFLSIVARHFLAGGSWLETRYFALLAFSSVLLGCALSARRAGLLNRRGTMAAILALLLLDISPITTANYPSREHGWNQLAKLSAHDDIAAFLRRQPGYFRIDKNTEEITYNFGDWFGFDEFLGYAGVTANILQIHDEPGTRALSGVAYYLARAPREDDGELVFRGRSGINVYRVPDAFPRAWTVHAAQMIYTSRQRWEQLNAPIEQLHQAAFLSEQPPELVTCSGPDAVQITRLSASQVTMEADLACTGMLVLANCYFPGWQAEVDGESRHVYQAYSFLQGVVVNRGHHRVRFFYRPASLYIGFAAAFNSLLGLVALRRIRMPFSEYPVI